MSEVLESLFGSKAKIRVLRYFLLNPNKEISVPEVAKKNMIKTEDVRKEINKLKKIQLVTERTKKGGKVYSLNTEFPFYEELKNFIVKANNFPKCKSFKKVDLIGEVKMVFVSGVFVDKSKSKVDLFLVVDGVKRPRLTSFIKNIEAEIGKEVSYVLMNSDELRYRIDMLDRFLIDFFKSSHEEIVNKIPKIARFLKNIKIQ